MHATAEQSTRYVARCVCSKDGTPEREEEEDKAAAAADAEEAEANAADADAAAAAADAARASAAGGGGSAVESVAALLDGAGCSTAVAKGG